MYGWDRRLRYKVTRTRLTRHFHSSNTSHAILNHHVRVVVAIDPHDDWLPVLIVPPAHCGDLSVPWDPADVAGLVIAVSQTSISADPRTNGSTIRSAMHRASDRGARLIQFPEGALSGYAKEQIQSWQDVDWGVIGEEFDQIADLAAKLRLWVLLGSAHRLTAPHRPHNSLYVISDRGTVVDRYDKRMCSNTEITHFYSPGFDPTVFEIDGLRFGAAVCIEVNFPELFAEYELLDVDCVLLSAYPIDSVFANTARSHAAINSYWIGLSAPAQTAELVPAALIGPDGITIAQVPPGEDLVTAEIDQSNPSFHVALELARPWRARARAGHIYNSRRVHDLRSTDRTCR